MKTKRTFFLKHTDHYKRGWNLEFVEDDEKTTSFEQFSKDDIDTYKISFDVWPNSYDVYLLELKPFDHKCSSAIIYADVTLERTEELAKVFYYRHFNVSPYINFKKRGFNQLGERTQISSNELPIWMTGCFLDVMKNNPNYFYYIAIVSKDYFVSHPMNKHSAW